MIQLPVGSRPNGSADFGDGRALIIFLDELGVAVPTAIETQVAALGNDPLVLDVTLAIQMVLDARIELAQRETLGLCREKRRLLRHGLLFDRLDLQTIETVRDRRLEVLGKAFILHWSEELLQAMRCLDGVMLLPLESKLDKRENHCRLQVGPQVGGHLFHDEIVNSRHRKQTVAGVSLPMDIPLGEAAVGDRCHHRLDDRDHRVLAHLAHQHLHHLAAAGLQLEVTAVQLQQAAIACQIVGNGDLLATVVVVYHIQPMGAGEQGENGPRLTRKEVGYGACRSCQGQ